MGIMDEEVRDQEFDKLIDSLSQKNHLRQSKKQPVNGIARTETLADAARVDARSKALNNEQVNDISSYIASQYPNLVTVAETIAEDAVKWASNYVIGQSVLVKEIPKKITNMQQLDNQFALLEAPGQACVIINRSDTQPIKDCDFKNRLSGEVVISGLDEKGQPRFMDASPTGVEILTKRSSKTSSSLISLQTKTYITSLMD